MKQLLQKYNPLVWKYDADLAIALYQNVDQCESPEDYAQLLASLLETGQFQFVPMKDLQNQPKDRVVMGLRHDIDTDLASAFKLAKVENALGLSSTYYVQHTEAYYGWWKEGRWHRHPRCLEILQSIQALGHEVALHNDCLLPCIEHGVPVAETLSAELDYLRSAGLHIMGSTCHNSYYSYNAANYEIFEGFSIDGRKTFTDIHGKSHPLGHLKMAAYGLTYEGNYIKSARFITKADYEAKHAGYYKCPTDYTDWLSRDFDAQYGIFGRDFWLMTDEHQSTVRVLKYHEILDRILSHVPGDRIVLDVHPIYYGFSNKRHTIRRFVRRF